MDKTAAVSLSERERLVSVLAVDDKKAADILTPLKHIKYVRPNAVLGPVLLDDLEKSMHSYFPVIDKKEGVVGILNLKQLANIGSAKQYHKVADIMSEDLTWVPDDIPVLQVANMFLEAKQYILLVQDERFEFAGIITIADLLENVIGPMPHIKNSAN